MNDEYFLIDAVADKPNKTKLQAKSQCLKITQNFTFDIFNLAFSTIFVLLKVTYLVTLFQIFKNSPKWTIYGIFNYFLAN